jgi:hypothetical protein
MQLATFAKSTFWDEGKEEGEAATDSSKFLAAKPAEEIPESTIRRRSENQLRKS